MTDLNAEFAAGYAARLAAGRCFEHRPAKCPHIATSACADAWHAGFAHCCNELAGCDFGPGSVGKVWHGRGDRVNVQFSGPGARARVAYRVDYQLSGPALAYLETL